MILVMSVLLVIMYFFMQQLLQDYVLTRLQHDAESLIIVLEKDSRQGWQVAPGRMSNVYERVKSGQYYRINVDDQQITSRSLFDADFPVMTSTSKSSSYGVVPGPGAETWLLWVQQIQKNGQDIKIQVAEDIKPIQQQLLEYTILALILVLVVTVILIYLQQRTVGRAFLIFEWLRQNLSSIRHRETHKSGPEIPREIAPLVSEIEQLVDHLHHRIDRTRSAIGNLAHELKRPLQLLALQQENVKNSLEPLEEIKHIIDRELRRAKISGSSNAKGDFNLADEMPYMIAVMQKIYPHIEIKLLVQEALKTSELDRDDFFELTGNLLDNACKFANSRVQLSLAGDERKLTLIIEDDGKGLDSSQIEAIQQRGVRLDETVAGHGLGLGICRDILHSYHGQMSFSQSALGGLKVCVEISLN